MNKEYKHIEISRVVLTKTSSFTTAQSKRIIERAINSLRKDRLASIYLITPGGFININFPADYKDMPCGILNSPQNAIDLFKPLLEKVTAEAIPKNCFPSKTAPRYISLGIDIGNFDRWKPHAEFVVLYDTNTKRIMAITGKSYPTSGQRQSLVRISNLNSHFTKDHNNNRVMILGCHDLNMFSNRVILNPHNLLNESIQKILTNMAKTTTRYLPNIILHHPHVTESHHTWKLGWAALKLQYKPDHYASGIWCRDPTDEQLKKILKYTSSENCHNIIIEDDNGQNKTQKTQSTSRHYDKPTNGPKINE